MIQDNKVSFSGNIAYRDLFISATIANSVRNVGHLHELKHVTQTKRWHGILRQINLEPHSLFLISKGYY